MSIQTYLNEVKIIADLIDQKSIEDFIDQIETLKRNAGRLFILGVGGSAGNASHAVNDFRKILGIESYCVTDNVSELTARINDESWEMCYVNWLKVSSFSKNDMILVLSVGGGSETTSLNLVSCMKYSQQIGASILSIVGRDGGYAKNCSNACIHIPTIADSRITPHAEEWQSIIWHMVVSIIKEKSK